MMHFDFPNSNTRFSVEHLSIIELAPYNIFWLGHLLVLTHQGGGPLCSYLALSLLGSKNIFDVRTRKSYLNNKSSLWDDLLWFWCISRNRS